MFGIKPKVMKCRFVLTYLTLSVLGHMAAIVPRPFSGNFTRSETHAVKSFIILFSLA
jgi:hypothetical protein